MGLEAHFIEHKRIALAALMGAALLAFVLTRPGIAPAGPAVLLVNRTANTSDGQCDANCTLREAIDAANTSASNTIHFDPAVFPEGAPAVIDIEGGDGALPSITADITIDATGSGVIIDGDAANDGTAVAQGLKIDGGHAGFGFTLHGGGHFTLRDIGARGIDVLGHSFPLDTLAIDGVSITDTSDDGIFVSGILSATHISLTNSTIDAGDVGIGVVVAGPNIQSMDYTVTNDNIRSSHVSPATGAAVALNMQTGLATGATINFTMNNNARLRSRRGVGINLAYCSADTPCAMDHSQINVSMSGNTEIEGDNDAIHLRLNGDPAAPASSVGSSITVHMDNNDAITAGSDVIDITSKLCCGANNHQTYTVDGNGPITNDASSGSDGIDIEAGSCCNPGSGTSFDISSNHNNITASAGEGVQLRLDCCGDNTINIQDNEGLISGGNNSIKILNCVKDEADPQADEADCIGRQTTLLTVANNLLGGSLEDGILVCCGEFQRGVQRSVISNNTIADNGRDGVEVNSSHGVNVGPGNIITRNGGEVNEPSDAVKIDIFASVLMFNRFGVVVPAGGNTITKNEIQVNGGLGIDLAGYSPTADPLAPIPDDIEYAIVGCHPFPLADVSANACRHSPSLIGVANDSLSGTACTPCRIEVFSANDQPPDQADDAGGQHGEGATFLAAGDTGGGGNFSIPLPCNLHDGLLTATATDSDGNTSEFSLNIPFGGTSGSGTCLPPTPTPTGTLHPPTPTPTPRPPTATPTPTRTATPSATATPTIVPVLCGDVDGDHAVNSIDAALVLQYTAGLLQTFVQPSGADVNHDSAINSIDAALILQATAGLPATLTCS